MNYEVVETESRTAEEGVVDLQERTKAFALRVVKMFAALPKSTEAQGERTALAISGAKSPRPL